MNDAARVLGQLAEARREYADISPSADTAELFRHEAVALGNVAKVLSGEISWSDLVAAYAPSWRWREFGKHDPTPENLRSDDRLQSLLNEVAAGRELGDTPGDQP